jgi:hypothetical protein
MINLPSVHDKTFIILVLISTYILNRLGLNNKRYPDSEILTVIYRAGPR